MSQENVELMRRMLDASNRRDRSTYLALLDPDIEWLPPKEWPEASTIHGREAAWDFAVELEGPWEQGAYELVDVIRWRR